MLQNNITNSCYQINTITDNLPVVNDDKSSDKCYGRFQEF